MTYLLTRFIRWLNTPLAPETPDSAKLTRWQLYALYALTGGLVLLAEMWASANPDFDTVPFYRW